MKTILGWTIWIPAACLLALLARIARSLIVEGIAGLEVGAVVDRVGQAAGNLLVPALLVGFAFGIVRSRWVPPWQSAPGIILSELGLQGAAFLLLLGVTGLVGTAEQPAATLFIAYVVGVIGPLGVRLARQFTQDPRLLVYTLATQVLIDGLVVATSWLFAFMARFDGLPPLRYQGHLILVLPVAVLFQLFSNYVAGTYRFVWRFTGLYEALRVLASAATAFALLLTVDLVIPPAWGVQRIPVSVLVVYGFFSVAGMLGARILRRLQFDYGRQRESGSNGKVGRRILLIGAGQAGTVLARDLSVRRQFDLAGFLDDDVRKQGRLIAGAKVHGGLADLEQVVRNEGVEEVILSMPSAAPEVVRGIVVLCERLAVSVSTVPDLADLVTGKERISHLRPIRMEDLLGRAAVYYEQDEALKQTYGGKRILVTGAGGSIGSELARQLLLLQPQRLILLDKDENSLYEIGLEIGEEFEDFDEIVADVRDLQRLRRVFADRLPDIVFHAAAYKHVPMMEKHPSEAVLNNVRGSANVAVLAEESGCSSFVLVSTDKAVNPTSVMGATKRIAEMVIQERAAARSATRFCGVRFGNVLGSRASVVPLFQKRISEGKPLHVTHPDVTRYFMTIPEAVQLVIQAGSLGRQGEIFILDMGDPVRIVDLARELIRLSGLVPDQDIPIEFTGLRPGEKLFEELLIDDESGDRSTRYPKIFVARRDLKITPDLEARLEDLVQAALDDDKGRILQLLDRMGFGSLTALQPDRAALATASPAEPQG